MDLCTKMLKNIVSPHKIQLSVTLTEFQIVVKYYQIDNTIIK